MLRDKVPNVLFFEVLDEILLQDERDPSTTLEGVTAGIRGRLHIMARWHCWRRLAGLDGLGVLGSSGRERRDIDLICNEEGSIETKSECTSEVSASALVAFGLEQEVSGLSPSILFNQRTFSHEIRRARLCKCTNVGLEFLGCHANSSICFNVRFTI